jgi:hypothetical protein
MGTAAAPATPAAPTAAAGTPSSEPAAPSSAAAGTPTGTPPAAANPGTPPAGTPPAAPQVPESYPLSLRDGSPLPKESLQRITERAKALGITDPKVAQAFVEVADAEADSVVKVTLESMKPGGALYGEMVKQWENEALAHPQVGNGDALALQKKAHEAGLAVAEHFPELVPVLKESGLAGRWEVIAAFSRLHRKLQETPLVTGTRAPSGDVSWERKMYPNGIPIDTGGAKAAL